MDSKFILKSKTIAGVVIKVIGTVLLVYGYSSDAVSGITDSLDKLAGLVFEGIGLGLVVYGRMKADKPLSFNIKSLLSNKGQ